MSKIFLIGDVHIGLGFPNKVDKWFKIHKEYFNDFLIPFLKENVQEGDIIVQMGDLFDNRNVIPINLLNYGMDIVEQISNIAPFHIIIGNHDLWTKSTSEINTIRPFKWIPNVHIYDKPQKIHFNNKSILMMPYVDKRSEQVKILQNFSGCDYLLCHSDLNGAKMHLTSVAHKNLDKIDISDFSGFKNVYSGHIHLVQRNKNFTFCGSIFQMDRNDYNDQKGIFILDTNTETDSFVENKVSPVFIKLTITNEEDMNQLDLLIDSKDYIDLRVSNSLIVSSRKLRRKLELYLEKGNFASIEYIDDIKKDEKVDESKLESNHEIDEKDFTISLKLDYDEWIRNWINNINWENEDIKNGVLTEYDKIIDKWKESYKGVD